MPRKKLFYLYLLFRATTVAYGSLQAKGRMGATATGLHHSHSNMGSKPHLQPTPQLTTMPELTEQAQGLNPHPHGS